MTKNLEITEDFVNSLEYQWSGEIELLGGQIISIWWTAWPPHRSRGIKRIINIYSDLPKTKIS